MLWLNEKLQITRDQNDNLLNKPLKVIAKQKIENKYILEKFRKHKKSLTDITLARQQFFWLFLQLLLYQVPFTKK